MRYILMLVASLFVLSSASLLAEEPEKKADPREKLETAIPEAIRLLEAKEYVKFLKTFVQPDDLQRISERGTLEEFAEKFGEEKAPRLVKVLKAIKEVKPEMNGDGTEATYELEKEIGGKKSITWIQSGKLWYIQN